MLKLLQGGNFVKINLELVLCFVYLGSTWITPICQIQLQKNLTVFVSPQLHCTFIISPSGKTAFISDETFYGAFAVFETIFETLQDASVPRAQVPRPQEDEDADAADQG